MYLVSSLRQFGKRTGDVVFLLVVLVTFVAIFATAAHTFTLSQVFILFTLSVLFALVGTIGFARISRSGEPFIAFAYFAVQIALASLIMSVSQAPGPGRILMLPLAAQAAALLPRRWTVLVCVAVMIAAVAPDAAASGWQATLPLAASYLAGVVFVVGFTHIARSEERARAEVERLAAELREANDKLREYALQVEELATTQERNRLAREIHDGLGHYLTAISMQLQAARAVWSSDPARAADALGKAQTLTREALTDVRRSVAALRASPADDRPLTEALTPLLEESRAAGIQTELSVNGAPRSLSPQAGLALYRAVQEGLTNVRKHAHASCVNLVLDYFDNEVVRLTVRDNGVGAWNNPQLLAGWNNPQLLVGQQMNGGFGLIGLRERVQYLGGELRVHTTAGQGFTLEVKVPG
jgi:signal transduction histidine kinase